MLRVAAFLFLILCEHPTLNTKMAYDNMELHVGQDMPELKPVETGPLPPQTTGVASLVIEAGTIRGENRCSPLEAHEFSRGRVSLASVRRTHRRRCGRWGSQSRTGRFALIVHG